jgi:hypothetical protein
MDHFYTIDKMKLVKKKIEANKNIYPKVFCMEEKKYEKYRI